MFVHFIAAVVSFLGIFCGALLAYIAPEELSAGKKYFRFSSVVVLLLVGSLLTAFLSLPVALSVTGIGALLFFAEFGKMRERFFAKTVFVFPVALFVALQNASLFFTLALLCFLYFFFEGTLAKSALPKKKSMREVFFILFRRYGLFLVLCLPLFFVK